jgi:hypothetical protein
VGYFPICSDNCSCFSTTKSGKKEYLRRKLHKTPDPTFDQLALWLCLTVSDHQVVRDLSAQIGSNGAAGSNSFVGRFLQAGVR